MPISRTNYTKDWRQVSFRKREDAGWKCEACGVPDGCAVLRNPANPDEYVRYDAATRTHYLGFSDQEVPEYAVPDWGQYVTIVLTVAHVDQDSMNNAPSNLRCWCQRCHLNYDRPFNIAKKQRKRVIASGQWALKL